MCVWEGGGGLGALDFMVLFRFGVLPQATPLNIKLFKSYNFELLHVCQFIAVLL